jgi:MFS transporter, DHA1 family, multidrug resistance protein
MRHMTKNWALRARSEEVKHSFREMLEKYVARPAKMLVLEPILLFVSLYISVIFGESKQYLSGYHTTR